MRTTNRENVRIWMEEGGSLSVIVHTWLFSHSGRRGQPCTTNNTLTNYSFDSRDSWLSHHRLVFAIRGRVAVDSVWALGDQED